MNARAPVPTLELANLETLKTGLMDWEPTRFPGYFVKVLLFRNRASCVLAKLDPGMKNFAHSHGFWQIRYVVDGEFIVNSRPVGPGDFIIFNEYDRYEVESPKGGTWLILQMAGPNTGVAPTDPFGQTYGTTLASSDSITRDAVVS